MIDVHRGTPEAAWEAWTGLRVLPVLDLAGSAPDAPIVVVAPHPDDEVLGIAGTLQALRRRGHRFEFVAVTDGEASHPDTTVITRTDLAARRRREAAAARSWLGLQRSPVLHLGLPDGAVEIHRAELVTALAQRLRPDTIVLAPWRSDGHPDHDATGLAAAEAAARTGARLVEYPVWAWNWARPADARVPWHRARRLPLSFTMQRIKATAIGLFSSQVAGVGPGPADGPILPGRVLRHHQRPFEVLFV
jgi:LmbE family N-acetylglucosaminyl deacetylase